MSIRVALCVLFVIGFSIYAYRNWFVSLCATIFLMAFLKHPDMPGTVLGLSMLKPWNLLLANVVIAWLIHRNREGLVWDLPRSLTIALSLYCGVILVGVVRLLLNPTSYFAGATNFIVTEYLLNSVRFLLPCLLFYDGCRTRGRVRWGLGAIILFYFLLAVQVVRYMGVNPDLSGSELSGRAAKIVQRSIGFNRVDMSMMLAGASWAGIAFCSLVGSKRQKWLFWGVAAVVLWGQALTGGRAGYVTWGAVGFILCMLKWRRLLPLIPVAAVGVVMLIPAVRERMLSGFGGREGSVVVQHDESEITSGRNVIWPLVIGKIKESPFMGYGRMATLRTGLSAVGQEEFGEPFDHPHEAYLEILLDNGVIGFVCILPLFYLVITRSLVLFRDRTEPIYEAAGGVALALVLALLFASFGAQTLYPREGVVGMWAAIGVALRVFVERARARSFSGSSNDVEDTETSDWQTQEA